MFTWTKRAFIAGGVGLAMGLAAPAWAQENHGLGRAATPAELQAWDIDVRADFKGLPKGSGTVEQGEDLWEAACASCHGSFGESNSFITPLVGGTTAKDIETGRVASMTSPTQSVRTIIMKVSSVSTLWDYIHRAMPWTEPKSLKPDEVYAVLAYLLNLAEIVDHDFTLSDSNIAEVQERMPNRNGTMFWEGLWKVDGKPDTSNTACMKDCLKTVEVKSELPDFARSANGDLAAQMRIVGPVRGVNTLDPALTGTVAETAGSVREYARATLDAANAAATAAPASAGADGKVIDSQKVQALLTQNACLACHARDAKLVGPSFTDISKKYQGQDDALDKLAVKIQKGGSGAWGAIPMPPHPNLSDADAQLMVEWMLAGSPQ
ncbi:MAG: c-type cytochrome [Burkholderiaceae bacterium]|nr:c-type cytochrome [Burkholderiaceae bacterium]